MKIKKYWASKTNRLEAEIPETWEEAYDMLYQAMDMYNTSRGRNTTRVSVAARVAFGMFNKDDLIPDPTHALVYLMMKICERKGAGLDK